MNYSKIFKTDRALPMLHYKKSDISPQILHADLFESTRLSSLKRMTEVIDSLFLHVHVQHMRHFDDYRERAVMVLVNMVGVATRRGCANILFVPNTETEVFYQHVDHRCQQIIVDERLRPNELRAVYWRVVGTANMVVDGGVQVSPDGLMLQANASAYFARCLL